MNVTYHNNHLSLAQKLTAIEPTKQQWDDATISGWDDHRLRHFLNWLRLYVPEAEQARVEREMHAWWRSTPWADAKSSRWSSRAAHARHHANPDDDDPNLYQTRCLYGTRLEEI